MSHRAGAQALLAWSDRSRSPAPREPKNDRVYNGVVNEHRVLWQAAGVECVMVSCCAGAELQVRRQDGDVLLRELYPTKSDLFERARDLEAEYQQARPPNP